MYQFSIVEIILIVNILHLLFFSLFLYSRKYGPVLSYRLLASFFISLALNLFMLLCFYKLSELIQDCPHLVFIGSPFAFLYPVFFYFYIKSVIQNNFKFKKWDFIHFMPFLIFTAYLAITHYFLPAELKRKQILQGLVIQPAQGIILTYMLHLQILIYFISGIVSLKKYQIKIKNVYSSIEKVNIAWIKFLFIGLMILWCFNIGRFVMQQLSNPLSVAIESFLLFSLLVVTYLILNKAMIQPHIFTTIKEKQARQPFLSEDARRRYKQKLLAYMELKEPYLNPDLTIFDLAGSASIPHRALSELINKTMNKNFFDFINEYRIRKAKELLIDPDSKSLTILGILYEVGFNSKSVFNSAFKKTTGMTPSQFKKQYNN